MSRLVYSAPILAALLSLIYARYFNSSPSASLPLPLFNKIMSPTSADTKGADPGQSVLMDQIVMFGDSITQGAWVPAGTGSTMAIAYQRKLDVMNRGLSGYNTAWGLPIIKQWLPRVGERLPKIKMLFIWFGANDAALPTSPQHVTLDDFKKNLVTILDLVRSPDSPYYSPSTIPILITPPPVDADVRNNELTSRVPPRVPDRDSEMTRQYAQAVNEVAQQEGVHSVDVWTAIDEKAKAEGGLEKYLSDGLHLTGAGYEVVTYEIAKLIVDQLPELHWDKLPQIFPHWEDCIPEAQKFKD
ncbi:SGNH/GDSL hydrolase family protein [Sporobolomyces salmoneus]|uniref:SGNH/GDSL hydrolase family protein n=1 Tax=Sporobolomyces salmoneus TaxID=183962 RepID=UPI00316B6A10